MIHHGNQYKEIHLLGASPFFPEELRRFSRTSYVRSTDTSSAFNYALEGKVLDNTFAPIQRAEDYFNLPFEDFDMSCVEQNIKWLRHWTDQAS
jgi:hypothetical protein